MNESPQPEVSVSTDLFCLFAGFIDQSAVQRFHNAIAFASGNGIPRVHFLFQTAGGQVGDGISLYNLFRASPVDITIYNVGSICSIGVIAFLGATHRKISVHSSFMIHKAFLSPAMATSEKLSAAAGQIAIDDERIESILKQHTKIPAEKWELHKFADVWISAKDAIDYEFGEPGEFTPPSGAKLFSVWPLQG